jgi:hypothetical protein
MVGGMDRQTLRDWVIRFNRAGPAGLINKSAPGAPGKLSKKHKPFLARLVVEDLLREILLGSKTIAVIFNADFGPSARFRVDVEAAARALGLAIPFLQASNPSEIETAFNSLAQTRSDALLVGPGPFLDSHRE